MPIYEYRCPDCDCRFEELVGFSAANEPQECPKCSHEAERVLSAFAVHVAGGSRSSSSGKSCSGCRKSSCASC